MPVYSPKMCFQTSEAKNLVFTSKLTLKGEMLR
jgi:hypothetical protein